MQNVELSKEQETPRERWGQRMKRAGLGGALALIVTVLAMQVLPVEVAWTLTAALIVAVGIWAWPRLTGRKAVASTEGSGS